MTEQPDNPPRRVVKKVVKKTVVRPVAPGVPRSAGSLAGRSATAAGTSSTSTRQGAARLTTPARAHASRPVTPAAPAAPAPKVSRAAGSPTQAETAQPPTAKRRRLPRPDLRARSHDALIGLRDRIEDAWDWLVSVRLPHLSPIRGSVVSGLLVGLLAVAIGWGFYELFSATLGTRAGGGWGLLAFVFLSFVAFVIGELLLAGFGVPHARVVSILSVLFVLLLVLVFFLKLAAGVWAWLLIPVLTAFAFVASSTVMTVAAKEQNPQRLPWEPVDETQVKRD